MPIFNTKTGESLFAGLVVDVQVVESRMSDYSDYHRCAIVAAGETWETVWIEGGSMTCTAPDAPPELMEAYLEACRVRDEIAAAERSHQHSTDSTIGRYRDSKDPTRGSTVRVIKGRKVPKGIYTVREYGDGAFGRYVHLATADLKSPDFMVYQFVSEDNVEVVDPDFTGPYCWSCRRTLSGWIADGFRECNRYGFKTPVCRDCQPAMVRSGEIDIETPFAGMPRWTFEAGEEGFAEALRLAPGDWCAWLVFADCLQENGDEDRADKIRENVNPPAKKPRKAKAKANG